MLYYSLLTFHFISIFTHKFKPATKTKWFTTNFSSGFRVVWGKNRTILIIGCRKWQENCYHWMIECMNVWNCNQLNRIKWQSVGKFDYWSIRQRPHTQHCISSIIIGMWAKKSKTQFETGQKRKTNHHFT